MIITGLCHTYKQEILMGVHNILHEYNIALYYNDANLSPDIKSYLETNNELYEGNGYIKGGKRLIGPKTLLIKNVAILSFENIKWEYSSFSAYGALIYNNTLPNKNAVATIDFGGEFTCINGEFEIIFPNPYKERSFIEII